ncbi:MAG: efflux RND transporter periplasmic adaptor subunit [Pseudohongiella sp.]|jgi:Cu(I)/Ag(I) efflux system membrane fusion protein|nr:efflux RND transporter periplasmic adaptor subunit [Pseudohongiella sp.]
MKRIHVVILIALLALAAGAGWFIWQKSMRAHVAIAKPEQTNTVNSVVQDSSGKAVLYWYDPMAPTQKFERPGKSPFMDMQLVPKYADEGAGSGTEGGVSIPSQTIQNLGIRLSKVQMTRFGEKLSAIGRIEPDERRFYDVQTRLPGFVEKLYARAVGDPVRRGQKIAEIYAPELLAAQHEYLALLKLDQVSDLDVLRKAARGRLQLLGMTEGEISAITRSGSASARFGIYAPASGVLTSLGVREGAQLMAGASLMQIADLSAVWLIAEVPERDAARLKPGIAAEVRLQSLPGEVFKGRVDYLYPLLDDASRTVRMRIELPNTGGQLRPGMYADIELTGQTRTALSVPSESIIATGLRKVVIVKETYGFRPAEIETGEERDGSTEILKGLSVDEDVVVSGQFLIDSEASLSGVLARLSQQMPEPTINALQTPTEHTMSSMEQAQKTPGKMLKGRGKVVAVDEKSGEITLAHEPISALGWPAMTMDFKVHNVSQLAKLKLGEQVEFELKLQGEEYVIERIQKHGALP